MSIQWNKEVKMSDVKKFFNQEVKVPEINYVKCLQTSALIVAFGIIPAFTYGTVLGTLDGQRVALMSEVSSLKAEALSAMPIAANSISNASTDKTVYAPGSPIIVSFNNGYIASSTNVVTLDLYANNVFVQRLMSAIPYQGQNKIVVSVATSSIEKTNVFTIRVTAIKYGKSAETNKFEIKNQSSAVSIENGYIRMTRDNGVDSPSMATIEIAFLFRNLSNKDLYISKSTNTAFGTSSTAYAGLTLVQQSIPGTAVGDTDSAYAVLAGKARNFSILGRIENRDLPTAVRDFRLTKIFYSDDPTLPIKNSIETPTLQGKIILSPKSTGPVVSVNQVNALILPGNLGISDVGAYRFSVKVKSGDKDMYVAKESNLSKANYDQVGFRLSHSLGLVPELWPVNVIDKHQLAGDTSNYFFIEKNTIREFDVVVSLKPTRSTAQYITLEGLNWKENPNSTSSNFNKIGINAPILPLQAR